MQISSKVLRVCRAEHISDAELHHMIAHAAVTSIRNCNLRFHQWGFRMDGPCLQDMQYIDLPEIGKGSSRMIEDHENCQGQGCKGCGWSGQISRAVSDHTAQSLER